MRELGHDVFSVYDEARSSSDDHILALADAEKRILITNDSDFGEKVFRDQAPHHGVVFLRLANESPAQKIAVLTQLLARHGSELPNQFVVVTEAHVRFARSKP